MLCSPRPYMVRLLGAFLLMAGFVLHAAPCAEASDRDKEKSNGEETRPRRVMPPTVAAEAVEPEQKPIQVAYLLYDRAIRPDGEPSIRQPNALLSSSPLTAESGKSEGTRSLSSGGPVPQHSPGVASTAPMSPGEKFEYWFHRSFLSAGAYGSAVSGGLYKELLDNDDNEEDTVGNYFADSMTRAARSFAFNATAGFFEKGVFPTIFRQDPRYHRSGKKGAGARIAYAVTRVFVTQGDTCGCHQFNASFLLGDAAATGIANLWERHERTGPMHNVRRFYTHIYLTALFNVVKEFVQGQ